MNDLSKLLRNTHIQDTAKLGAAHDTITTFGAEARPLNLFGRVVRAIERSLSPEVRAQNRAGLDAYVREIHAVNAELAQVAGQVLSKTRQAGKPLTVRMARELASNDLSRSVERQAAALKQEFFERGVFGADGQWRGSALDEQRLRGLRQSLELVLAHLRQDKDGPVIARLENLARGLDTLRGIAPDDWVVPAAKLTAKGQQCIQVFSTLGGKMVKTGVTASQLEKLLQAHGQYQSGHTPEGDTRALRRHALEIIKATGQHRGLRILERSSTADLVDLARQVSYGIYTEFDTLRAEQADRDARVLDPESLRLLQAYNEHRDEFLQKVQFAPSAPVIHTRTDPDDPVANTPKPVRDLRAFYAQCLSPLNVVELEQQTTSERMRQACQSHVHTLLELVCTPELATDPELSQVPPEVLMHLGTMLQSPEVLAQIDACQTQAQQLDVLSQHLASLPPSAYDALAVAVDASMATIEPLVNEVMSQLSTEFGGVPGNLAKFLSHAFRRYYAEQSPQDQKTMLASYMRQAVPDSSQAQALAALIQGAGPFMIKMLQMVGDNIKDSPDTRELKDALSFVKSGMPSIHPEIRNALLAAVVDDSGGEIRSLKQVRSLGAASVGETFVANVEMKDGRSEQVVVKLLRPGIQERAGRERRFMDIVAQSVPGMAGTFAGIADQIEGEMDLRTEAGNVRLGAVYDDLGHPDVRAMKLAPLAQTQPFYMLIEKAPGSTVSHYMTLLKTGNFRNEQLHAFTVGSRLGRMTSALAEKWVEEALFGSGFYHGDLHAGNLMYKADQGGEDGTLTVIDFGNSKVLSSVERQSIFKMMLTATLKNPAQFCTHFEAILSPEARSQMTPELRSQFIAKIDSILKTQDASPGGAIALILDAANELGIEVPGPIANFSRSELMMENTLKELAQANANNWEDYRSRIQRLPEDTRARQAAFDACLAECIQTAQAAQPPKPTLVSQLQQIQATAFDELEDAQLQILRDQPGPMAYLTTRRLQVMRLAEETLPEAMPDQPGIEDAIMKVMTRHLGEVVRLAGAGLGLRAAAGLTA